MPIELPGKVRFRQSESAALASSRRRRDPAFERLVTSKGRLDRSNQCGRVVIKPIAATATRTKVRSLLLRDNVVEQATWVSDRGVITPPFSSSEECPAAHGFLPGTKQNTCRLRKSGHAGGFTLVELMVAISIFATVVVLLAYASGSVSKLWVSTRESSARQQRERVILDFIARDLEGALFPIVRSDPNGLQLIRNPATVSETYQSGDTLFWQAPIASDTTQGDIAVVGYFVKWEGMKSSLCRLLVPPNDTANYRIYTYPGDWINDAVIASAAPADKASGYLGLMAENIVGFWAQALDSHGNVIATPADFDSRTPYTDSSGKTFPAGQLPPAIKISIAILDSQGASRLTTSLQPLANTSTDAADFINRVNDDPVFTGIASGLRSYTSSISLINSR